jgi:glutamyl-tRNA synthetase
MTNTQRPARVRFAPSPTGFLHLGGARTAIFDWLYARRTGGQFILRIEDTDQKRFNPASLENLAKGLRWLGLDWDEGPDVGGPHAPYVQSERRELYQRYAEELVASGHAYRSYTTGEELDALRAQGKEYDRRDRWLTPEQIAAFKAEGRPSVVRFAGPLDGTTTVHDLIRGEITVDNRKIMVDPVLLKSDGLPTYHLAAVVDDHLMEITHVLRGEEWLPSAPIHKLLFDAFGWDAPQFIHLPVILDPGGKGKMSKRKPVVDGREMPVFVHDFMDEGYLPDALFNFLANMGWNFDAQQEVFSREEAIARFDVADINPAAAALPYAKLEWMNGVYIRALPLDELRQRIIPFLSRQLGLDEASLHSDERLTMLIPLIRERIKTLSDAAGQIDWAFVNADAIAYPDPTLLIGKKLTVQETGGVLRAGLEILAGVEPFSHGQLEEEFRARAEEMGIKVGSFFQPFRVAITGRTVSPPLFESMVVLGRTETIARVTNALHALQ